MKRKLGPLVLLLLAAGCEEVESGDDGGSGSASASASESATSPGDLGDSSPESGGEVQAGCRETCDDLLLFGCIDADVHEACYDACSTRSTQDIETFEACVDNTLPSCAECYENFVDAEPIDPPDPTTGDDPQPTCTDSCEEFVGAGCTLDFEVEFTSCEEFCGMLSTALQQLVVDCVAERDGCTLPEYCSTSGSAGG